MKQTIENIVAGTILEDGQYIKVNGKKYKIAKVTVATMIEVSRYISLLPKLPKFDKNVENVLQTVLYVAKDCDYLGDIAAILMLGKKGIEKKYFFGLYKSKKNYKKLSKLLLESLDAQELSSLISTIIEHGKIGFFLGIITFLSEINLLKSTKDEKTIVSGQ